MFGILCIRLQGMLFFMCMQKYLRCTLVHVALAGSQYLQ